MVKEGHGRYLTGVNWSTPHGARTRALLAAAAVALGAALRVRLYLANYSLSIDEAAIARNLQQRSWLDLLGPIDYAQAAPPGFLLAEKLAVSMFGSGELALRLFPLLAGLLSLILAWAIVRRMTTPLPGLAALTLIALSRPFIEFSAIAKQYSCDIAATLGIVWLMTLASRPLAKRQAFAVAAAALVIVMFSFTAVFALAAGVVALIVVPRFSRQPFQPERLVVVAVWTIAACLAVVMGRWVQTPADAEYLHWFWAMGFMPLPPHNADEAIWLWRQTAGIFGQTSAYRGATAWLALAFVGVWSCWRRGQRELAAFLILPLMFAIVAAMLRLYPLGPGRVHLYVIPPLLLLAAEGLAALVTMLRWRSAAVALTVAAVASAAITSRPWSIPSSLGDVRAFVADIAGDLREHDAVYVYYWAAQPFLYYAPRFGLTAEHYSVGHCSMGSGRTYLRELQQLAGASRLWVALPHRTYPESETILAFLDQRGERHPIASGFGYRYDLTTNARGSIDAESFPLPPDLSADEPYRLVCHGVFQPVGE
jgi:hypothetical protein